MTPYFFDTSALAKRYLHAETGSGWVQGLLDPAAQNVVTIATIASVELAAALAKRVRIGSLTQPQCLAFIAAHQASLPDYVLVPVEPLFGRAQQLAIAHGLRAYDAVQLAAAIDAYHSFPAAVASDFTFLSADTLLLAAAAAEGLATDDPNRH